MHTGSVVEPGEYISLVAGVLDSFKAVFFFLFDLSKDNL